MRQLLNSPLKVTKFVLALLLFAGLAGYVMYQAHDLINGPRVAFALPEDGASVKNALVTISGHADNISFLHLNGRQIYVDDTGEFSEQLLLAEGYNIIEVSAEGRFGKKVSKTHEIVYIEPRQSRAASTSPALTRNP